MIDERINPYTGKVKRTEVPYPCDLDPAVYNVAAAFWRPSYCNGPEGWMAPKHGTGIRPVLELCGCDVCMAEHARLVRELEEMIPKPPPQVAELPPTRVPAEPVRKHVAGLVAAGWSRSDIATASGVDRSTIDRLLRPGVARVQRDTADAVMAVTL